MIDENKSDSATEPTVSGAVAETSPAEPFVCPNCGQLLAPACRVCVACREPVDFTKVGKPEPPVVAPVSRPAGPMPSAPVGSGQFSWPIFFICVAVYLLIGYAAEHLLKGSDLRWFVGGLLVGCGAWVYYDARRRSVPHPLRWAIGSFLIWIVVFPWYISRRRKPEAPCLIMEAPGRAFLRTVIWVLLLCAIVGLISAVMRKPPH
ncbi:MAG: hypothetical protein ACRD18_15010 [Terriglobia bacterium]